MNWNYKQEKNFKPFLETIILIFVEDEREESIKWLIHFGHTCREIYIRLSRLFMSSYVSLKCPQK